MKNPRFHQIVNEAKQRIREITPAEAELHRQQGALLVDVREAEDFTQGHAAGAVHLSRGTIELKIEERAPDMNQEILCYCGGGSRSALVAESLQRMGYTQVRSVSGGFKAWKEQGLPTE